MPEIQSLKNKYLLLIADDDADDQLFMKDAVEETGIDCEVNFYETGVGLLEFVESGGQQLLNGNTRCMIFLDLNMPQLNGKETLRQLRSKIKYLNIPVFILSTSASEQEVEDCYHIGANAVLQKPYTFQPLKQLLLSVFNHWGRFFLSPAVVSKKNNRELAVDY